MQMCDNSRLNAFVHDSMGVCDYDDDDSLQSDTICIDLSHQFLCAIQSKDERANCPRNNTESKGKSKVQIWTKSTFRKRENSFV